MKVKILFVYIEVIFIDMFDDFEGSELFIINVFDMRV